MNLSDKIIIEGKNSNSPIEYLPVKELKIYINEIFNIIDTRLSNYHKIEKIKKLIGERLI